VGYRNIVLRRLPKLTARRFTDSEERIAMSVFAEIILDPGPLVAWLVVGLIAGWLVGQVMKGGGYGIVGDMIVGVIGALIGGFVTGDLGFWGGVVVAFVGACIFIVLLRFMVRGHTPS